MTEEGDVRLCETLPFHKMVACVPDFMGENFVVLGTRFLNQTTMPSANMGSYSNEALSQAIR